MKRIITIGTVVVAAVSTDATVSTVTAIHTVYAVGIVTAVRPVDAVGVITAIRIVDAAGTASSTGAVLLIHGHRMDPQILTSPVMPDINVILLSSLHLLRQLEDHRLCNAGIGISARRRLRCLVNIVLAIHLYRHMKILIMSGARSGEGNSNL